MRQGASPQPPPVPLGESQAQGSVVQQPGEGGGGGKFAVFLDPFLSLFSEYKIISTIAMVTNLSGHYFVYI